MAVESGPRRLPPPWLGHLLIFGVLFLLVLGWFVVQTRQAEQVFLDDASAHARLLTDAVQLHARGALLAEDATATLVARFLGSSARFVDYLDGIEPFRPEELRGFANEAGLLAIRIVRPAGTVQGPEDWDPGEPLDCRDPERLRRLNGAHGLLRGVPRTAGEGCVLVAMDSRRTEALEAAVGLPQALASVAALPGVVSVRLEGEPRPDLTLVSAGVSEDPLAIALPPVTLRPLPDGRMVAQASAPVAGARLRLELDAGPLLETRMRQRNRFLSFVIGLAVAAGLGAWLLYRYQRAYQGRLLYYERQLSRQREEAALGRAAAAIAHEVRNPLNAMAMGLQRLQLEAQELTPDHRRLVDLVQEAVRRTNGTVVGLLDYARPVRLKPERLELDVLTGDEVALYRQRIASAGLRLDLDLTPGTWAVADPRLLRQVLDNLLRNALEADAAGGSLEIRVWPAPGAAWLTIANDGFALPADEAERILEPWFTTKTAGTGLGLAISQRIVQAHGGHLTLELPRPGRLRVRIELPARSSLAESPL